MTDIIFYATCMVIFSIGAVSACVKRHLINIKFSIDIAFLGVILLACGSAALKNIPQLQQYILAIVIAFAIQSMVTTTIVIYTYRVRASLKLREFRELRD